MPRWRSRGLGDERLRVLRVAVVERRRRGVEHLTDRGQVLNGAIVDELGKPAPLVALGPQALAEAIVAARALAQSIIASRSAIATACVRVSASSFARMWRTWLFTVSCEMKSLVATSAFE